MYWATAGGMFLHAPGAQCALVVGATAGLIGGLPGAPIGAGLAMLVGLLTGPTNVWTPESSAVTATSFLWVALGVGVAALIAWVISRRWLDPRWVLVAVVVVMLGNVWWTTIEIDSTPTVNVQTNISRAPLDKVLEGEFATATRQTDDYLYAWVLKRVREGTGYYEAFTAARISISPGSPAPTSALNIRQPLLYELLAAASSGWYIILGFLTLATVSSLSVFALLRDVVKPPVALPGVAAVLSYAVALCTTTTVLYAEAWSGMLILLAAAALATAQRSQQWRAMTVAAAALTFGAFLVREFALFALLAGLVAAWLDTAERKRFGIVTWLVALVGAVAAYAAHLVAAAPHIVASDGTGELASWAGRGGWTFALSGFTFNTHLFAFPFSIGQTVPLLFVLLGLVGAFMLRTRQTKVFVLGLPVTLFAIELVAGNGAEAAWAGASVNYWGMMMLFTLYACMPAALALVPVARGRTVSGVVSR